MNINEVSKQTGISKDMIRFYEKKGIIHPKRLNNNYRDYSVQDVHTIILAKQYSLMGVQLNTISSLFQSDDMSDIIQELDSSIQRFQDDLFWANARLKNANDFRDIFRMIEDNEPYQIIHEDGAYFYSTSDGYNAKIITKLLQHGSVCKSVFRIHLEHIHLDSYPQDYGLILPQEYPNTSNQYEYYGPNIIYRTIIRQSNHQLVTNETLQQLQKQIEAEGYEIIGDSFISQLSKQSHQSSHFSLLCFESIVKQK